MQFKRPPGLKNFLQYRSKHPFRKKCTTIARISRGEPCQPSHRSKNLQSSNARIASLIMSFWLLILEERLKLLGASYGKRTSRRCNTKVQSQWRIVTKVNNRSKTRERSFVWSLSAQVGVRPTIVQSQETKACTIIIRCLRLITSEICPSILALLISALNWMALRKM